MSNQTGFYSYFKTQDQDLVDLVKQMLCFNPEQRLTSDECLTHPIFDDIRNEEAEEPFEDKIQLDDLKFLEELNENEENIKRLKGVINNEISYLM